MDALTWLESQTILEGSSVITSMPDYSEFPKLSLEQWKLWFTSTASLILSRCPKDGVAIFYQRDRKREGTWVDKGYLLQKAAEQSGHEQLWHKIICRAPPGQPTFGSTGYSHMLCFSRGIRPELTVSTADVLPLAGSTTWTRGMGVKACVAAVKFVINHTETRIVVDPFCGHGTVLAIANELGLDAVGVERGRKRAEKARSLSLPLE
jgi:hypothetical protein